MKYASEGGQQKELVAIAKRAEERLQDVSSSISIRRERKREPESVAGLSDYVKQIPEWGLRGGNASDKARLYFAVFPVAVTGLWNCVWCRLNLRLVYEDLVLRYVAIFSRAPLEWAFPVVRRSPHLQGSRCLGMRARLAPVGLRGGEPAPRRQACQGRQ